MTITHTVLGRVLHMSTKGIHPISHSDREATLKLILGRNEVSPLEVISVNRLSPEMRLLH